MRTACVILIGFSLQAGACQAQHIARNQEDLTKAIAATQPGDTIIMSDGVWKDASIVFSAEGEKDRPITLRAQTPGKVILAGQSRLQIAGKYLVVDGLLFKDGYVNTGHVIAFQREGGGGSTHCRLTNTAIINFNPSNPHSLPEPTYWVSLWGHDNRVDHCYIAGKDTPAPTMAVWVENRRNDHLIDHNYFAGRPPLGKNGGETIRVGLSTVSMNTSGTRVENNLFEHCDGEVEIISNKSCENVYRYNTFRDNKGTLTLRHGNRCTVESNWFFGDGIEETGGIRIIGEDHKVFNNYLQDLASEGVSSAITFVEGIPNSKLNEYFQVKRATVCFNTIVNCRQSMLIGWGKGTRNRTEPVLDCTIANNLVVSSNPAVKFEDQPHNATWLGNIFFDNPSATDPRLTPGKDGIYRPAANSPAIGAAAGDFAFVTDDIEGRARGAKKDVGCFQAGAAGEPKRRPLTAKDVGPAWMLQQEQSAR